MKEYNWKAQYNNGESINGFDSNDNPIHKFTDIEQDKLKSFELIPRDEFKHLPPVKMFIGGKRRLIYTRRTVGKIGGKATFIYIIGWHETLENSNRKSIVYIYSNGNIEMNYGEPSKQNELLQDL